MLSFIPNTFVVTYREASQLGIGGIVSTKEFYNAMPIGSSAMLYDTQVTDPPFIPCVITIDKPQPNRSFAKAEGIRSADIGKLYFMDSLSNGTLSGTWTNQNLAYFPGDKIIISKHTLFEAIVSSSKTILMFTTPLDKPMKANSATFEGAYNVRGHTANYLLSENANGANNNTLLYAINPPYLVWQWKNVQWDIEPDNNIVLDVDITSATITFT